jgi:hypothetical protein
VRPRRAVGVPTIVDGEFLVRLWERHVRNRTKMGALSAKPPPGELRVHLRAGVQDVADVRPGN